MKTLAKWSIEDYHQMVEAGILHGRHLELLGGKIVEMSPETPIHYTTAKQGTKYLEELLSGKADVRFNLKKDLEIKLAIYATAGIQEYWVLDLSTKQVIVFRNPQGDKYVEEYTIAKGTIAPLAFADISVSVKRLLP